MSSKKFDFSDIITINGVIPRGEMSENSMTIVSAKDAILKVMEENNKDYAYVSINKFNIDVDPLNDSLFKGIDFGIFYYHVIGPLEPSYFNVPYLDSFEGGLITRNKYEYISGNYIVIFYLCDAMDDIRNEAPKGIDKIVNSIRLTHGVSAIGSPVYEGFYDRNENRSGIDASLAIIYPERIASGDASAFTRTLDSSDGNFTRYPFNEDADILFKRAINEREPRVRFLFFWLCSLCILSDKERRDLFGKTLKSNKVNQEVLRLRDLRNEITHQGRGLITEKDCSSVLWMIRTAISPGKISQTKMCLQYEIWLDVV